MRNLSLGRRQFFRTSALGALGAGWAARSSSASGAGPLGRCGSQEASDDRPRIKEYRPLGRTGFKVSDIACGFIMDEGVIQAAYESGMNYFDTAEEYPGHHRVLGRALRQMDRSKVFVTTKLDASKPEPKEAFLKRARKALEELQLESVDCLMMHCPEKAVTLQCEGFHAAMTELKAEGRVRHVGVSHHGSFWLRDSEETMEKVLSAAADDGRFDVFLMAYNFLRRDGAESVLEACRRKNIGVALMKTTPVATYHSLSSRVEALEKDNKDVNPLIAEGLKRYRDMVEAGREFLEARGLKDPAEIRDASVRFVLSNPAVHTACLRTPTYSDLDAVLRLSGSRPSAADGARLDAYREGCGSLYCRHACGVCEPGCPHGVPVNTIMRYNQYFVAQRREKEAMTLYAAIPGARADVCAGCDAPCEAVCPYGVPVQGMLLIAHDTLSMPWAPAPDPKSGTSLTASSPSGN